MSLKINGRNIQSLPLRFRGGVGFEYAETNKSSQRNIYASDGITDDRSGNPAGHLYPSAWIWPQKSGSITSFKSILGASDLVGSLALGLNGGVSTTGTSTFSATGFVTANISATITGTSAVTGTAGITLNGAINITSAGTVSITSYAVGFLDASIGGSAATVSGVPFALGLIECDITPFTELSPQNLAQQLLDNEDIEDNYSLREAIRIILSMSAGKLSGASGTSILIRDVNDTKDRISATVDSSGNRTAVTLDAS
jgi:hypothetical protein